MCGLMRRVVVINYFGPEMYKALGLSDGKTLLVQGIYGAVGPITNFLCVLLSVFPSCAICGTGIASCVGSSTDTTLLWAASSPSFSIRWAGSGRSCSAREASS